MWQIHDLARQLTRRSGVVDELLFQSAGQSRNLRVLCLMYCEVAICLSCDC